MPVYKTDIFVLKLWHSNFDNFKSYVPRITANVSWKHKGKIKCTYILKVVQSEGPSTSMRNCRTASLVWITLSISGDSWSTLLYLALVNEYLSTIVVVDFIVHYILRAHVLLGAQIILWILCHRQFSSECTWRP